ncbi:MAG TPA: hypothetical protein VFP69_18670 [Streptomyces sp.]|nr:hypothetical protein [Streptomyces sp.]
MLSSLPPRRVLAVAALLLAAATAAPALTSSPPAAAAPPACGKTSAPLAVTGGTVTWCEITLDGQPGGRLTFKNTGRAYADLSLVVYDCDGGTAPDVDAAACGTSLAGTYDVIWREVKSKESVSADFQLTNKNAQVWWTADKVSRATDLKLLGTPWNA